MLSTKFQFIRESGFRGEYFLEINQSETRIPQAILVIDWLISKKYSPLKPLSQMN
jgi:hypothetical protein